MIKAKQILNNKPSREIYENYGDEFTLYKEIYVLEAMKEIAWEAWRTMVKGWCKNTHLRYNAKGDREEFEKWWNKNHKDD